MTLRGPLTEAQHETLIHCWETARSRARRVCRKPANRSMETMNRLVQGGYLVALLDGTWAVTRKTDRYASDYLRRTKA
jgi:hypothetical protein